MNNYKQSLIKIFFIAILFSSVFSINNDKITQELLDSFTYNSLSFDTAPMVYNRHLLGVIQSEPTFIPLGDKQRYEGDISKAFEYIMNTLDPSISQYLLYPYPFNQTIKINNTDISINFPDGALISTKNNLPDQSDSAHYFKYIYDESNIDMTRSKALYDVNVAVLVADGEFMGQTRNLLYESFSYCIALHGWTAKYENCFTKSTFEDYYNGNQSPEKASFIYLEPQDIIDGYLMSNDITRFGILILPDIYVGSHTVIRDQLGSAGYNALYTYINAGGVVLTTGRGALILSELEIIPKDTFNYNYSLNVNDNVGPISGCEIDDIPNDMTHDSWIKRSLCFSTAINGNYSCGLYEVPLVNNASDFNILTYWDINDDFSLKDEGGFILPINNITTKFDYPHIMHKTIGAGHIIINLGNPINNMDYYQYIFNSIFVSMSRPLITDSSIHSGFDVIPGLEQLKLGITVDVKNLYNSPLYNVKYILWIAKGLLLFDPIPSNCIVFNNTNKTPPIENVNNKIYLECSPEDVLITQAKTKILMLYPIVEYSTEKGQYFSTYMHITIDAKMAALIRADLNPDPSSHYPILGRGQYIDGVLPAENKEDTMANNVHHIAILPLVSPVVDGDNQAKVLQTMDFDYLYYLSTVNHVYDYPYPMTHYIPPPRHNDTLDWRRLASRHNLMAADWDTPVKIFKKLRSEAFGSLAAQSLTNITNLQYSTNVDNDDEVLNQVYFPDSDNFYEHATQRLLAFLNTATPEGYASYNHPRSFPGGTPSSKLLNSDGSALRTPLIFTRNDIYFYDVRQKYPLPKGVNNTEIVFTIDRYNTTYVGDCAVKLGDARATRLVEGYFDIEKGKIGGDHYPPGMKPHEYSNELLTHCDKIRIDVSDANPDILADATNNQVKLVHYIVRLPDNNVKSGDDAMDFKYDSVNNHWYYAPGEMDDEHYGNYPEVRLTWTYQVEFRISPAKTRRGGKMVVKLPDFVSFNQNIDPISAGAITFGADQISILRSEYDKNTNTLTTYFKRGNMPNEQYGKDSFMEMNIEFLITTPSELPTFNTTMTIYEMIYDLSYNPVDANPNLDGKKPFERYLTTPYVIPLNFHRELALSLPALRMDFSLSRGENNDESFMMPYEGLEPFVRYGIYMQELKGRRTVWGSAEVHPVSDVGLVGISGGFSWPSHVGISSIPFREYLTTGSKQMIPSGSETGRIDWTDIWGRSWTQPIRSVFVDVPPIPPPLRNFMMSTTFELLDPTTNRRSLEWRSEDTKIVRAHIKLLNNYPKWWEITNCKDNQILQYASNGVKVRIFLPTQADVLPTVSDDTMFINQGYTSAYGSCFSDPTVYASGHELTQNQRTAINNAQHCSTNEDWYDGCEELMDVPTVTRQPANDNTPDLLWNYAPEVANHWPQNYIKPNMWNLQHYDYDDTPFDKAYKYHMDNNLPNIDKIGLKRPHNIIAFPIYKGLGYRMYYDKTLSHINFPDYKGWWSDQLQNRDHTCQVGQSVSNDVSMGQPDLTLERGWIPINELKEVSQQRLKTALGNLYVCEFNRHRVKINPTNPIGAFPDNHYQNNIVPIDPSLEKFDKRLYQYDCDLSKGQYTPQNISQFYNYVPTETARDWLYFAANLRGGALENINILYKLEPYPNRRHEGVTKVQDGGRFVYWNPANGPNSFLVVDNLVNTVLAKRTDLVMEAEVIPTSTITFGALTFHLLKISDIDEVGREWLLPIYINHHGYGDAVVSIYVGGFRGSQNILNKVGDSTYAKVEFYNNAGFDWNLYANAINATELESKPISGNDLLFRLKHAIRVPNSYNFMTVHLPDELKPFIKIEPSSHNIDTAPLFFDFEFINVARIRDGFKGQYYYKITVIDTIPIHLRGRLYNIPVTLNTEFFDKLPGMNDPTNLPHHDFTLTIPDIVIGFPYDESSLYAGKVFYTSGYAENTIISTYLTNQWVIEGAQFIDEETIRDLRDIATNAESRITNLENFWNNLTLTYPNNNCPFTSNINSFFTTITYNLGELSTYFPIPKNPTEGPDQAVAYILAKATAEQLTAGTTVAIYNTVVDYTDFENFDKVYRTNLPLTIQGLGAYIEVYYNGILLSESMITMSDQRLRPEDGGVVRVRLRAINIGTTASDIAYNVNFTLTFQPNLEVMTELLNVPYKIEECPTGKCTLLTIYTNRDLTPGNFVSYWVYIKFPPLTDEEKGKKPTNRVFIERASGFMDLTQTPGERVVEQVVNRQYLVNLLYVPRPKAVLTGRYDSDKETIFLECMVSDYSGGDVVYLWRYHNPSDASSSWKTLGLTQDNYITQKIEGFSEMDYVVAISAASNYNTLLNLIYTNNDFIPGNYIIMESNIFKYADAVTFESVVYGIFIGFPLILAVLAGFWFYCFRAKKKFVAVIKEAVAAPTTTEASYTLPTSKPDGRPRAGSKAGFYKKPTTAEKNASVQHWGVRGEYLWTGVKKMEVTDNVTDSKQHKEMMRTEQQQWKAKNPDRVVTTTEYIESMKYSWMEWFPNSLRYLCCACCLNKYKNPVVLDTVKKLELTKPIPSNNTPDLPNGIVAERTKSLKMKNTQPESETKKSQKKIPPIVPQRPVLNDGPFITGGRTLGLRGDTQSRQRQLESLKSENIDEKAFVERYKMGKALEENL